MGSSPGHAATKWQSGSPRCSPMLYWSCICSILAHGYWGFRRVTRSVFKEPAFYRGYKNDPTGQVGAIQMGNLRPCLQRGRRSALAGLSKETSRRRRV